MNLVLQFLEEGKIQILSRTHSNGEELERAEQFGALPSFVSSTTDFQDAINFVYPNLI